jgi:hypothetical protein
MFTAVYKVGNDAIDGYKAQCKIVKDTELHLALDDGWFLTLAETLIENVSTDAEPQATRDEMIQQAEKIGLKVDKRWSDARLLAEIEKVSA